MNILYNLKDLKQENQDLKMKIRELETKIETKDKTKKDFLISKDLN